MEQEKMSDKALEEDAKSELGSPTEQVANGKGSSEIQITIGQHSKYIADNFDKLYDEVQVLKGNLTATETLLRNEMDAKLKAMESRLAGRIGILEQRTAEQWIKIAELESLGKQQATQLDDLQNQCGILFFRFH
ncbi:uncharacterized protein [Physcomitrium patens]|uniref:uncharacterized protein n=1 Tax=Physcomitrium patens TaxID=3218 RepID=UPI000D1789A2|nr:uncharacterized protein LOC112282815 [Physcomitrium patens]|eukprot:XP_024376663.1 uncharacterized protein LOC112282815 [Physcomitrella patens]